jgi:hypothetical protein
VETRENREAIEAIAHDLETLIQRAEARELRALAYLLQVALMEVHDELGRAYKASN